MAGSRDRWSRLLWWSGLSKLFRNGRTGSSSLGLGCVSVRGVFLFGVSVVCCMESWLFRSLDISFGRLHHMPHLWASADVDLLLWIGKFQYCFALYYSEIIGDLKGCFVVPFGKCINLHYREPRKIRSLIPNQNPLTNKADRLVPCLCYASAYSALEYNGYFLRFLPQTGLKSMQRSPNITHD